MKLLETAKQFFAGLSGQSARFGGRLDDVRVLANSLVLFDDGSLDYLWFEIEEHGRRLFRVVKLAELTYLPQEARADAALIKKQAALQRGLIAVGVELITLSFGIFDPPMGIVQCYGVGTRADTREQAAARAEAAHAALLANFAAQFPQIRFAPLAFSRGRWLVGALGDMQRVTALVGQPDPRESARGGAQQQTRGRSAEFTEQQNELLFRALARAKEEFIFMNIATPVAREDIARMQASLGNLTSPIASRQVGSTSIGFGVSLPVILSVAQGVSAGQAYGTSQVRGESDSVGVSHGVAQTDGIAHSSMWSRTVGQAHSEGVAHTESVTHTSGVSHGVGVVEGAAHTEGAAQTAGTSETVGAAQSHGVAASTSTTEGHSSGWSLAHGASLTQGVNAGGSVSAEPLGVGARVNVGGSAAVGESYVGTSSFGSSVATTTGVSTSDVTTTSHATSVSHSSSVSQADTTSQGRSESWGTMESTSVGRADTRSATDTVSESATVGGGTTVSTARSVSQSESAAHGVSRGEGIAVGRTLGAMQSAGLGAGVAPSVSVSKSFQWKDENAVAITELLEQQLNILKEAAEEGGLYSDVYILTRSEHGRRAAEAGAVQAFGGSQGVVTHVQPRRPMSEAEEKHLRLHISTFTPSTLTETLGWINGYAYSTLITPTQQAAYSAPGLFEEGTALTVQERTPPFAFRAGLPGDVVLGHLFSTERGEQTSAPLALTQDRHFHTVFAADTGFGKTVAAERLAVEVVQQWQHRVVVLDFGAGWRKLINSPIPPERIDLYQLYPGAPRPFRWNFMQIGRRIHPDQQYPATAELLCAAGRMGPRQIGLIRRAMRELYVEHGVLIPAADDTVQNRTGQNWTLVQNQAEADVIERDRTETGRAAKAVQPGQQLVTLDAFDRQALYVHRSKQVDVTMLYGRLEQIARDLGKNDPNRTAVDGALVRLEPFTSGELARLYGRGEGSLAVEDLGLLGPEPEIPDRWGLCILEGGAQMDEYSKIVILSLVAWHLYQDAIKRRQETIGGFNRTLDIIWEEANKLLGGVGEAGEVSTSSSSGAISLWQAMWRDGRKYRIFMHPLVQTLSDVPPGILTSCNNAFFGQMKGLKDRDLAVGHLARSERGFTDEEYKRYLSRIPRELAIVKLGYSNDVTDLEPMLARPLMVDCAEPTDGEVLRRFGGFG